jgi:hypothetical protein
MLSTGRYPSGELIELHNHFGRDMSPDMSVPGARLAREAYVDIYAHNYIGAFLKGSGPNIKGEKSLAPPVPVNSSFP